jgi:hypothetical protein
MNQHKDILITNISAKYGSPELTKLVLEDFLEDKFKNELINDKYGLIHNIRILFDKNKLNQHYYYGFLSMVNYKLHDDLHKELMDKQWIFGDLILIFEKANSYRAPTINYNNYASEEEDGEIKKQEVVS